MYSNPLQSRDTDYVQELRRKGGEWLREKRIQAGLSQRALGKAVGFDYYTFISQLESGRGRVPPERYAGYAKALGVSPKEFATVMLRYNDPITYELIFESDPAEEIPTVDRLEARLKRLEALVASSGK